MSRSPKSRGKGNRRWPGRRGGARKKRGVSALFHRAQHMVGAVTELSQPTVPIMYEGVVGKLPEHNIYIFDQEMARIGVHYFAEYHGRRFNTTRFTIFVSDDQAAAVSAIASRLRQH